MPRRLWQISACSGHGARLLLHLEPRLPHEQLRQTSREGTHKGNNRRKVADGQFRQDVRMRWITLDVRLTLHEVYRF